eukprot:UN04014
MSLLFIFYITCQLYHTHTQPHLFFSECSIISSPNTIFSISTHPPLPKHTNTYNTYNKTCTTHHPYNKKPITNRTLLFLFFASPPPPHHHHYVCISTHKTK